MVILSVILVIVAGLCMAFQSPTNATLTTYVGNFQASTISFGGGTLVLLLAVLIAGTGDLSLIVNAQWWQVIGGSYGAYMILIITYGAPILGIALTLTFIMFGQVVMGIIIDFFGWFGTEAVSISGLRVLGCVIVGIGIIAVYVGKKPLNGSSKTMNSALMGLLAFVGGVFSAMQSPTNASLAAIIGKLEASFVSFSVGFLLLLIVTLITYKGKLKPVRGVGIRPWMVTGGLYGACTVFFNVIATPYIGVALVVAGGMLGQLGGGIIVDCTGVLRAPKIAMNGWRYAGVIAIAIGVVLVTIARIG